MVIVDAFNVIHAAANLPNAASAFKRLSIIGLARLIAECPTHGSRGRAGGALLVVDGTGGGLQARLGPTNAGSSPGAIPDVQILFAGPGREADAVIEDLLEGRAGSLVTPARVAGAKRSGGGAGLLIVSSDKRVRSAAKGARAQWLPSDVFLGLLAASWMSPQARLPGGGGRGSGASVQKPSDVGTPRVKLEPLDPESARWWMRYLEVDDWDGAMPEDALHPGQPPRPCPTCTSHQSASSRPTPTTTEKPHNQGRLVDGPTPRAVPGGDSGTPTELDPLLLEALRVWAGRLNPGDLEMRKWLSDDQRGTRDRPGKDERA